MVLFDELHQHVIMLAGLIFFWVLHRARIKVDGSESDILGIMRASLEIDYRRVLTVSSALGCLFIFAAADFLLNPASGPNVSLAKSLAVDVLGTVSLSSSAATVLIGTIRHGFTDYVPLSEE